MALKVEIKRNPDKEVEDLIFNTEWGSQKGIRYLHRDTRVKIKNLINPFFINLRKSGRLLASFTMSLRNFQLENGLVKGYYIRYFSFKESLRTNSKKKKTNANKGGIIKTSIREIFRNGDLEKKKFRGPEFFYAYVEMQNERSKRFCEEFEFKSVRKFSTHVFSRFKPKRNENVERIGLKNKAEIKNKLKGLYSNYNMYYDDRLFEKENYYVLKKNGVVMAGAQFSPVNWQIKSIPGISGKFLIHALPYIPIIKKIFNPKDYRFLGMDQIYYQEGNEKYFEELIEAVMAEKKYNMVLTWTDNNCSLNSFLSQIKKGLIHKLKSDVPGDIIMHFVKMRKEQTDNYSNLPAYIGVYDLT